MSPRANCLVASKALMECGRILEILRKEKNAKEYNAVNCMGNWNACVVRRICWSKSVDIIFVDFGCRGRSSFNTLENN